MGFSDLKTKEKSIFIPIEWAEDGSTAPAATVLISNGNGSIRVRKFDGVTQTEDVVFPWQVPNDIVVGEGIKYQVVNVVTEATGPSAEEIAFDLAGYCSGSGDGIGGTFGTRVESASGSITEVQYDLVYTSKSNKVTVTDLAAGELAQLRLERDHDDTNDTYGQDIGVAGIIIYYTSKPE